MKRAVRGEEGLQVESAKFPRNAFRTERRAYLWLIRPTSSPTSRSLLTRECERTKKHRLIDPPTGGFIAVCTMICGSEDFTDMELFVPVPIRRRVNSSS